MPGLLCIYRCIIPPIIDDELYALSCLTTLSVTQSVPTLRSEFGLPSEHVDDVGTLAFEFQSMPVSSLGDRASRDGGKAARSGNETELLP